VYYDSIVALRVGAWSLLLLCFPALPSCASAPPVLEDSLGTRVTWMCEGHECQVTGTSDAPPDCDGDDIFVVGAGAIAILCAASVATDHSLTLHEATCRPLICATEGDCPQWPDRMYGCDGGFCTTASLALDAIDVEATCLRLAPRQDTCAATDADPAVVMATSTAMAACTTSGCTIPESCRP
jgi:hypothetical protein